MKNLLLSIGLFSLSSFTVSAQDSGIIAGENNNAVFYYDIPDSTLYTQGVFYNNSYDFDLDLDGDGVNDFLFTFYSYAGTGNRSSGITINPYRNNEVCYHRVDTQYIDSTNFVSRNVAKPFVNGEVIHGMYSFDTATAWIDGSEYGVSGHLEDFYIDDWSMIGDRNIGLKMSINDTMVFAWVKVNVFFDEGVDYLTLKEYAYAKRKITHLEELSENSVIKLFPNPVKNNLHIELPNYKAKVDFSIYTVNGEKIETHSFQNKKSIHLNTNHLAKGIYILAIQNGNDVSYSKFVKE